LFISDDAQTFVSLFAPEPSANASRSALKLRLAQFAAVLDPRATAGIASKIATAKIKAEEIIRRLSSAGSSPFSAPQKRRTKSGISRPKPRKNFGANG
jgi:hypothetical protein